MKTLYLQSITFSKTKTFKLTDYFALFSVYPVHVVVVLVNQSIIEMS